MVVSGPRLLRARCRLSRPLWESSALLSVKSGTQHAGKLFPSGWFSYGGETTAEVIEGISFVRFGGSLSDLGTLLAAGRR